MSTDPFQMKIISFEILYLAQTIAEVPKGDGQTKKLYDRPQEHWNRRKNWTNLLSEDYLDGNLQTSMVRTRRLERGGAFRPMRDPNSPRNFTALFR
jgi:hypothetical protein